MEKPTAAQVARAELWLDTTFPEYRKGRKVVSLEFSSPPSVKITLEDGSTRTGNGLIAVDIRKQDNTDA